MADERLSKAVASISADSSGYLREMLLPEYLRSFGQLLLFFLLAASILLLIRRFFTLPSELFRKLLHIPAITSVIVLVQASSSWIIAVMSALSFVLIVYPLLALLERVPGFSRLLVERAPGEIKMSLLLLFGMEAAMIALCWGYFRQPAIAIAGILAWGCGDAAAALIGKRYGKHRIHFRLADGQKTWEGSLAMALVSFAVLLPLLNGYALFGWPQGILIAAITAILAALMEMISHRGSDTVTVPCLCCLILLFFSSWLH